MASRADFTAADRIWGELRAAIQRAGWSHVAAATGLDRTNLHRSFSARGPKRGQSFGTIAAVADALGLELALVPKRSPERDLTHSPDFAGGYDR